ncbi:MAG: antibiotic biosynthesis monooxygenase [Verrucomicrobia bacterium]|nr:antibiotic biosynthesis monooxygenase [Verrucomicrobiota bacterium]MBU1910245.1 antibiotic biosynthesis monooxygenase [Verrucomicrobiota bacterium]
MYVTLVHVHAKEEFVPLFIQACKANHEASVNEPGNCRFDILQSQEEPDRFVLCEAYVSKEAAAAHKQTAHYAAWRDAVAGWMTEPRKGVVYNGLFPA